MSKDTKEVVAENKTILNSVADDLRALAKREGFPAVARWAVLNVARQAESAALDIEGVESLLTP